MNPTAALDFQLRAGHPPLSLGLAIAGIVAKDFVVPIMALENVGWQDAWRRFLAVARANVPSTWFILCSSFFCTSWPAFRIRSSLS